MWATGQEITVVDRGHRYILALVIINVTNLYIFFSLWY